MRLEMQAVCDAVHGAKNDAKQLSDAARRFERYAVVFRAHSSAEDDLLLPALELREAQTRGIETTPENDGAHDVETQKLEAAEQAFTKLLAAKPNSADFKRKLASLKLELDGFREFMADHMLEEEEERCFLGCDEPLRMMSYSNSRARCSGDGARTTRWLL